MTIEFEDGLLFIKCSGNQFSDQIESCKLMKMYYDPDRKSWKTSAARFNDIMEEMSQYKIEIDEYSKKQMKQYFKNMNELEKITKRSEWRRFDQSLLKVEPL